MKNKFNSASLGWTLCLLFAAIGFLADLIYFQSGLGLTMCSLPIAGRFINRNSGAGGDGGAGDDKTDAEKLLEKIEEKVKKEIETRGYQNAESVKTLVSEALKGLNLEALRAFDTDKEKMENSIKNIAGELEKVKNAPAVTEMRSAKNGLKKLLDDPKTMKLIERAFDKLNPQTVVLNVRAAAAMTLENTIEEYVIPDDIIESFSVDGFIKKRRPTEYIFDIASRRTVANITEYKTWLEEGDEEGAFAIVEEGAVKPLVSKSLVRNTNKYKKIAGKRVYTEEFAMFRKEAYNILEDLFNEQLIRNYDAILTADLITKAAGYVGTALDGQYTNPTDYHAIGAVAAQIESLDFFPDLLILNPQDKWRIALETDSMGRFFVNIPMYNPDGEVIMMGFRVKTSNRVPVGFAILGEAKLYKVEDQPVSVRLGYGIDVTKADGVVTDVTSDVDNNRFRIIAETFFHNYIGTNHLGSFVYFNFAAIKELLTAEVSGD